MRLGLKVFRPRKINITIYPTQNTKKIKQIVIVIILYTHIGLKGHHLRYICDVQSHINVTKIIGFSIGSKHYY